MRPLLRWVLPAFLIACAHEPPEGPPKILRWSDSALGSRAAKGAPDEETVTAAPVVNDEEAKAGLTASAGGLGKDELLKVVKAHETEVQSCYERGLAKNPKLGGKVVSKFSVGATGKVEKAGTAETTLGDPAVERCIADAVKSWKFPKASAATEVTFPFTFKGAIAAAESEPEADELTVKSAKDLQSCYERFAKGAKGSAAIEFAVVPPGKVGDAKVVESTIKKPKFDACIVAAVKTWPFPKVTEKTPVKLPIQFDGAKAAVNAGEGDAEAASEGGGEELSEEITQKLILAIKEKLKLTKSCFEKQSAGIQKGKINVQLKVGASGKVAQAELGDSEVHALPGGAAVEKCVLGQIRKWSLISLPKEIQFEIPVQYASE